LQVALPQPQFDRFNLRRVCRQVYHETGALPYTTNTLSFDDAYDLKIYACSTKHKQLQYIQSLAVGQRCSRGLESVHAAFQGLPKLPALEEASVTLWRHWGLGEDYRGLNTTPEPEVEDAIRRAFEGKRVTFWYLHCFSEWSTARSVSDRC
jgi:hypothetical protein